MSNATAASDEAVPPASITSVQRVVRKTAPCPGAVSRMLSSSEPMRVSRRGAESAPNGPMWPQYRQRPLPGQASNQRFARSPRSCVHPSASSEHGGFPATWLHNGIGWLELCEKEARDWVKRKFESEYPASTPSARVAPLRVRALQFQVWRSCGGAEGWFWWMGSRTLKRVSPGRD